jgi:hypothetical protein
VRHHAAIGDPGNEHAIRFRQFAHDQALLQPKQKVDIRRPRATARAPIAPARPFAVGVNGDEALALGDLVEPQDLPHAVPVAEPAMEHDHRRRGAAPVARALGNEDRVSARHAIDDNFAEQVLAPRIIRKPRGEQHGDDRRHQTRALLRLPCHAASLPSLPLLQQGHLSDRRNPCTGNRDPAVPLRLRIAIRANS